MFCSNEDQRCGFLGTAKVAYGANGRFVLRDATDGSACDNATFDDPLPHTVKSCFLPAPPGGNVTYTLVKAANPTAEEQAAYVRIAEAMDGAVALYGRYTRFEKHLTIYYEPGVATADGNINGTIRFGPSAAYQTRITATHELAHTVGVGTAWSWGSLVVNGQYTGAVGTRLLRAITGNGADVLKGDGMHFWPFGLNYASEVSSETDLVNHCKLVEAMRQDGL